MASKIFHPGEKEEHAAQLEGHPMFGGQASLLIALEK